jgi:hypothetical protein
MEQLRSGSASESSSLEDIFLQLTDTGEQADVVKLLYGEAER